MKMKKWLMLVFVMVCSKPIASAQKGMPLEHPHSVQLPETLAAATTANRVAWTLNEEGKRNIWVAEGPAFTSRRLTSYLQDDGQPLSDLNFSEDGNAIVYVRGEGKNASGQFPNPT